MRAWRAVFVILIALAFLGASATFAQEGQVKKEEPAVAPAGGTAVAAPAPAGEGPAAPLTKPDVDGWLDGLMPYALSRGDIAGAVVTVVKDGQVLTERGFGLADVKSRRPVDPERTLFRPGSVSKLFTWTAVMQQVEAGKLDLDTDINTYLDFKIPPREGKPVTMRDLMTHTSGFGEAFKGLFVASPERLVPLGKYLASWTPPRIFPPGQVPAYSNYGAGLAGYIVERLSGEPFDDYIERHIFVPLGMTRSSFRQPLPDAMKADMSSGYLRASGPARPYELITGGPAGSLTATGSDMSRFMIAHLQDGRFGEARILRADTARRMRAPSPQLNPPLNGMALGFYHEDRNGHQIVGHAGDTAAFHSDLHILPDDGVGLFISLNSTGKEGAAGPVRAALLRGFMDRYFPAPKPALPTLATAKEHGRMMAGLYRWSRRSESSFFTMTNLLGQVKVKAGPDGTLEVSVLKDASGAVIRWREVAPFVWQDPAGEINLAAVVKDGKVVNFTSDELPPVMVLQPVPGRASAAWNMPLLYAMVVVLMLAVLLWPVTALVRRHYGRPLPLAGWEAVLYRLTRVVALIDLLALLTYVLIISLFSNGTLTADVAADPFIRVAQGLCLLGVIGAVLALWNAFLAWTRKGRSRWAKISATVIALACVAFVWFVITLRLVTASLKY
ncbi:MAG: serine hydrolase domain-containing protein [Candidatus Aminicenantes bacterium]|nr:serine hydrolase domain-containing protein [Candidatus Aminicenantes bacterium]